MEWSPVQPSVLEWRYQSGYATRKSLPQNINYLVHKDAINRILIPFENIRYYNEIRECIQQEKVLAVVHHSGQ